MEEFYHSISKAINIDQDREEYTELFNFVRKSLVNGLKENPIFKGLFADLSLCGSYPDNLKVSKPDEFDLVFRLTFPFHDDVNIEKDPKNGGNVFINLLDVIYKLTIQNPRKDFMIKFLKEMTNADGYLLQDKFQSWFEGILTKYLIRINHKLVYDNYEKIYLRYVKQGPAHTIQVKSSEVDISIDFVPGFRFNKSQSISPVKRLIEDSDSWEAIPKPINGRANNPSFQCSYTESERRLLSGRNQFKNTLRMMKKFRDMNPALVNLKSYYIKTLFLWHNQSTGPCHWNQSNQALMDEMLEVLEKALEDGEILFYWDKRVNLLKLRASEHQINCMYHEVRNARKIISKRNDLEDLQKIKDLFLTRDEQKYVPQQLKQEIERTFWDVARETVGTVASVIPMAVGIGVGAFLIGALFSCRQNNN